MLRTRLATAAVAIPALWLMVWGLPTVLFAGFVVAVVGVGMAEFCAMAVPEHPRLRWGGVVAGLALAVGVVSGPPWASAALAASLVGGMADALASGGELQQAVQRVALWMLGLVYVAFLTPHVVLLREHIPDGWCWVLFVVFTTMGSDTGGYFTGRAIGRRKLLPAVSPKKTVEGAIGAGAGAVAVAALCWVILLPGRSWGELCGLGLLVSALGQVGDLCESALKRAFAVKDSGWIVPGHGGILDRLDSLVFPFVAVYHYAIMVAARGAA